MNNLITDRLPDPVLVVDMSQFLVAANANKSILGLLPADFAEFNKLFGDFGTAVNAVTTQKATTKSTVASKNAARKAARIAIGKWAKTWRANPAIPDAVLDALLVPNHSSAGTKTAPTQPLAPVVSADTNGMITLSWNRNGNGTGTIFSIETAPQASGPWTIADSTSRSKITYQGTPGDEIWFRIAAKRNQQTSQYSSPISMWASGGTVSLEVAA